MYIATITRKTATGKTATFRITGKSSREIMRKSTLAARRAVRINGGSAEVTVYETTGKTKTEWNASTGTVRTLKIATPLTTFKISKRAAPTISRDERLYLAGLAKRAGHYAR